MSKNALTNIGTILQNLGLAVMIGGMLALGALVAPTVFHNLPIKQAGQVMTLIFMRHDVLLWVSLGLVLAGEGCKLLAGGVDRHWVGWLRYGVLATLTGVMVFSMAVIHPKIQAYQQAGVMRKVGQAGMQFDAVHRQSESLYKTGLLLAVGVLILASVRPAPNREQLG